MWRIVGDAWRGLQLEREKADLEDRERRKGQTGDELGKALTKLTKEREQIELELTQVSPASANRCFVSRPSHV